MVILKLTKHKIRLVQSTQKWVCFFFHLLEERTQKQNRIFSLTTKGPRICGDHIRHNEYIS